LKWPGLKLLLKNFHFWEFFNLGRSPTRIRPSENSLCFSITLKCAFEPLIIIFRAFSSLNLLSSASSSPWPSKVVHFLSYLLLSAPSSPHLISFKCAFEPSTIKGSAFPILPPLEWAFEPSPHFFSSAPSSPQLSKVVYFLSYLLLSAPSSPHLNSFRVRLRALDHQR
jgi:hypothetical protein